MKKILITAAVGALAFTGLGVGIAQAAIPDSSGVIHGCYKPNANGSNSALGVIDTALPNGHCPSGDVQLTWPSAQPALNVTTVTASSQFFGTGTTVTATCPAGTTVTGGGFDITTAPGDTASSSHPDGNNGWTGVMSGGPSGAVFTVYAECASLG